ncbi:hypothetical protein CUMW_087840 [Citrus unshiu]|nr:hypothetical protein CUMW_087840 [Citrus unshiu]
MIHHSVVKIFTTEMCVSGSGLHFEDALSDGKQRHIKSASTQIKNQHILFRGSLPVQTISNGGGSGLTDDFQNIKPGHSSGILRGLTLRVSEGFIDVRGHSAYH